MIESRRTWMRTALAAAAAVVTHLPARAQGGAHDHGAAAPHKLTLNQGRKWATDEPLRVGMGRIRSLVEPQLEAAHAGKLFACRDAAGHLSVVDRACPGAVERREIVVASAPANRAGADADAKQIAAWSRASQARLPPSLGGTVRPQAARTRAQRGSDAQARTCATARVHRAKREREDGFHLGFDERRRLLDAELAACGLR